MKINKWTLGLAAVGLVSLSSVANAEEAATSTPILTALSSTTISGYIDTSAQWNPGTGVVTPPYAFAAGKQDGFNLNAVDVKFEKPLEEGEWSAGYALELMFGPDAGFVTNPLIGGLGTLGLSEHVRQAYVALRAPVGNGLDLKVGRFDGFMGYESTDSYKNPNFTRSYGYTMQPTEHTGVLATYQFTDMLTLNAGIANTVLTSSINDRSARAESHKTYMASVAFTAPDSMGILAGSALYAGVLYGDSTAATRNQIDTYVGGTIATPVAGLRLGASFDSISHPITAAGTGAYAYAVALYASFKPVDTKWGVHARAEYARAGSILGASDPKILALTGTLQYDLWQNVLSRLEVRWDHTASGGVTGIAGGPKKNEVMVAANLVYKF